LASTWSCKFDFVDAHLEGQPAPGVANFFPPPYFIWHQRRVPSEVSHVHERIRRIATDGGPYDCVIGFSEGASLAAALLLTDAARESQGSKPMFRYAIFLNAVNVSSPSEELGKEMTAADMRKALETFDGGAQSQEDCSINSVRIMSSDVMSAAISIPTLHVIGSRDGFQGFSRDLVKQCKPSNARVINLPTGHEVPKGRDMDTVALEMEEALATVSLAAE
jgi:hypothetical protein